VTGLNMIATSAVQYNGQCFAAHTNGSATIAAQIRQILFVLTLCRICKVTRSKTAMVPLPVQHHRSDPTTAKQCTMLPKAFAGTS